VDISPTSIGHGLNTAHQFLLNIEPEPLAEAPFAIQIATLWVIFSVATVISFGTPGALGEFGGIVAHRLARRTATNAAPQFIDLLALMVVNLERFVRRYGLDLTFGEEYVIPSDIVRDTVVDVELSTGPPRASHRFAVIAAGIVLILLGAVTLIISMTQGLARLAIRPTLINAIAWTLVLWHLEGVAPLVKLAIDFPAIPASQIVAGLTITALVYAVLGSDLRGRAEINKTASVEVRAALLSALKPLEHLAESLWSIREVVAAFERRFPDSRWLTDFADDPRCSWQFNTVDHPDRWFRQVPHIAMILTVLVESRATFESSDPEPPRASSKPMDETAATEHLATFYTRMVEADSRIQKIFEEIVEKGYSHKLTTVLPGPVGHAWTHLVSCHFHRGLAESLPLATQPKWDGLYLPDHEELRALWRSAETSSERDIAAAETAHAIRRANSAAQAHLWQLAVTEKRIRVLIDAIEAMLSPRLLERLRQAIHK